MGGSIFGAPVRLDLDDPTVAPTGPVVADEASAEQGASDLGRAAREERPIEDAQAGLPG